MNLLTGASLLAVAKSIYYFVQDCSSEDDFILDIKQPVQETGDWCHIWETPRYICIWEGWHACMPFG